ncbi:unnamed protein product [Diatraea saccharalis]|uniref:SCP domain-containing protein n=1 Tax=Diatraea saccharalis TaxID=40085 RepID=A0A9N9RFA0_9NEOP|nr:unnamed protein product [Diatraea saccharalis]
MGGNHDACVVKGLSPEPDKHCIDYARTITTSQEKIALLNKINERRNKIAAGDVRSYPSADSMLKLTWNEELEKSAQRWADQCVKQISLSDQKDTCRDLGELSVGQNIATVYGEAPGLSPLALVDVWYTELLNANVSEHLEGDRSIKNRTVNRLVCNFAVGGNVVGETVYTSGPPCSRCPVGGVCDIEYTSLCNIKQDNIKRIGKKSAFDVGTDDTSKDNFQLITENSTASDTMTEDETATFDYISQYFDFSRQKLTTPSIQSSSLCKGELAVDEFIELLKKKLSNDPLFKDILQSTTNLMLNGNNDFAITDPNVAVFVSKIYSKKVPTTTTKLPEQEYVNSTLLVDLVEAVIFRSGEKTTLAQQLDDIRQSLMEVSPVKVQAELAEVKLNHDFTGHYFFPEDNTEVSSTDTIDSYDDTSGIPVSDVVLEIQNLKRTERTKDFLDDIIDSDYVTESQLEKRKRGAFLKNEQDLDYSEKKTQSNYRKKDDQEMFIKYDDLLKTIAADLKPLKLNERFHCSFNKPKEK